MTAMAERLRAAPLSFMRWWLGELGSFLPGWMAADNRQTGPALILDLQDSGAVLAARRSRRSKTLGRTDDEGRATGFEALRKRRYRRWPLIVRLAPDLGMQKVIDLPLAARNDLDNLLQFELDRLTPFSPDEVFFAWRVQSSDRATGRMSVALDMAPKALVERAFDLAAEHGRGVDRVEIEGGGTEPLNLLQSTTKAENGGRFRHVLPLLVLALAIAAVWIPLDRQQRVVDRLEADVTALKASAEETLALRDKLDAEASEAGFLARAKNSRPSMTAILAELTELIPDHSYILQLEIGDGEVQLSGYADKASDLITILDRSEMFASPEFRSAVTRDPRVGKERFQIAAELAEMRP
ncbi:MAG: PilN domain-containing protein [Alphaproteobacteria bacterium]